MSPKKSFLTVGLTALGLFGYTATRAADPGGPAAPSGPPPAPASKPTHSVLLKTNGQILKGVITEEGANYVVHLSGGPIPVPKSQVERTFESLAAVYRYKREGVDGRDPDEHLKLAKWCLSHNMPAEAKAELQSVVAVSPKAIEAKRMLKYIEDSELRNRRAPVDPALVRTGAEEPMSAPRRADARPAEIDPSAMRNARRDLGVTGLPVVLDLPPTVAAKRFEWFARDVHPVLQAACARCHNEQYQGSFQLVEVKSRRGPSGDVLRANLDATLGLVDRDNLPRSQLLSSALVPHGSGPNPRPIFRGSNDPRYQIIAAWVNSLRIPRTAEGVMPTQNGPGQPPAGQGFAAERVPGQGTSPGVSTTPVTNQPRLMPGLDRQPDVIPPTRFVPGQGAVVERTPPSPDEFPVPYAAGGPPPRPSTGGPTATPPAQPAVGATSPMPVTTTPVANPAAPLPSLPPSATAPASPPAGTPAAGTTKAKPPVKIDPALLEKALSIRNGGR